MCFRSKIEGDMQNVTVTTNSRIIGDFYFLLYSFYLLVIVMIFSIMSHFSFFNQKNIHVFRYLLLNFIIT